MVGPMAEKFVWFLFPVFISITKFSDFLVMSYGNWKHILGVFSFHNFVFNGIFVVKTTYWVPWLESSRNFWPFFFLHWVWWVWFLHLLFFLFPFTLGGFLFFFFSFPFHIGSCLVFFIFFFLFSSFTGFGFLGFFFFFSFFH